MVRNQKIVRVRFPIPLAYARYVSYVGLSIYDVVISRIQPHGSDGLDYILHNNIKSIFCDKFDHEGYRL